jgi:hypothetical protein
MTNPPIENPALIAAYREVLARVEEMAGITGVDVGYLYVDGHPTDELGVRVYTPDPQVWSELTDVFANPVNGVKVSPLLASYRMHASLRCESLPDEDSRIVAVNPVKPGVSIANRRKGRGTLGLLVDHRTKGRCILSCAHILVDAGSAPHWVVQPATGGSNRRIANVHTSILDEDGDAAIAILTGSRPTNPAQLGTDVVIRTVRMPSIGEIVTKSGVTTGVTCGRVDGCGRHLLPLNEDDLLPPPGKLREAGMDGFRIVPVKVGNPKNNEISGPGDSGSTWYAHDGHAGVGLHVAGERDQQDAGEERAIACYLPVVLTRLEVTPAVTGTR